MAGDGTLELIRQAIDVACKKSVNDLTDNNIKVKTASVIAYDQDTFVATIYFIDDSNKNEYTLYNKSGESLSEGDVVKVYYTTNVAKGWIGARMGEPIIDIYVQPNSQGATLKEYEVLSDTEIKYNGVTYTFSAGDSGEITEVSTDKGGAFAPTIPGTIANIAVHNAAFMAVAMLSKLDKEPVEDDIPNSVVRFNTADYTVSGTTIIANNQCGEGEYEFRAGAIDDNAFKVIPKSTTTQGYGTATLPSALNQYTIYIAINAELASIRTMFIRDQSGGYPFIVEGKDGARGQWVAAYYLNEQVVSTDRPSKKVFALVCDGTAAQCYLNGVQTVDWSFANELPQNLIFTNGEYLNSYFDGCAIWLYDLAISDAAHDAATVGEVSAMLMEKYNIGGTT